MKNINFLKEVRSKVNVRTNYIIIIGRSELSLLSFGYISPDILGGKWEEKIA
jgi:hypothetical protein